MRLELQPVEALRGEITVPGDKSITHRALLLSALADGPSRLSNVLQGADCRATLGCLHTLGVAIEAPDAGTLAVVGHGLRGWREPESVLDCGGSGTTMRLLCGLLAGQRFYSVLSGNAQLSRRPMDRVAVPLRAMGARIEGRQGGRLPPLSVIGCELQGTRHTLSVASAQVKSCLLLAGLYAHGTTTVEEPALSRDHTERMLAARGVVVAGEGRVRAVSGPVESLQALDTAIPGDLSSAAFWIVAATLVPRSELLVRNVGVNPTRTGLLEVLGAMGADIELLAPREEGGEPVADLLVRSSSLRAVDVGGDLIPRSIDELPILALAATQAEGVTRVRDAAELRVKETDRVSTVVALLRALGARVEACDDGFEIEGPTPLNGTLVDGQGDHRIVMTAAIAGLLARGHTVVVGSEAMADSYPGFDATLAHLLRGVA